MKARSHRARWFLDASTRPQFACHQSAAQYASHTYLLLYGKDDELPIEAFRTYKFIYHPQQCIKCIWGYPETVPKTISVQVLVDGSRYVCFWGSGFCEPNTVAYDSIGAGDVYAWFFSDTNNTKLLFYFILNFYNYFFSLFLFLRLESFYMGLVAWNKSYVCTYVCIGHSLSRVAINIETSSTT